MLSLFWVFTTAPTSLSLWNGGGEEEEEAEAMAEKRGVVWDPNGLGVPLRNGHSVYGPLGDV